MSLISSYKKQLKKANVQLSRSQQRKLKIESQMQKLQKEYDTINTQIDEDTNNVVTKGMLYYNETFRERLLKKAEELNYSQIKIEKLRSFAHTNWNADIVDLGTITELEAIENYIDKNSPDWTKSFFAKLGNRISGDDE